MFDNIFIKNHYIGKRMRPAYTRYITWCFVNWNNNIFVMRFAYKYVEMGLITYIDNW
jgi:hypothetical protein